MKPPTRSQMYTIHPYGQSAQRGHCSIEEAAPVSARIAPLSPTRRAMKGRMGDVMTWECSTNDYRKRLENIGESILYIYIHSNGNKSDVPSFISWRLRKRGWAGWWFGTPWFQTRGLSGMPTIPNNQPRLVKGMADHWLIDMIHNEWEDLGIILLYHI